MSRVGKKIRILPDGVTASLKGDILIVKGPKGELALSVPSRLKVAVEGDNVKVGVVDENSMKDRAIWGTASSLINNMIIGVTQGFKKQLEINGVGFKAALKGAALSLEVGFSHPVEVPPPPGIKYSVEKNIITVEGINKEAVGEAAAALRRIKKPEPYKGKGIKYVTETIRRKAGKTAAKTAAA